MYFSSPFELYVDLTGKCNLNCDFCMRKWKYYTGHKDDGRIVQALAEEIVKNDIPGIVITGGEPFLAPGIFEFIIFLKSYKKKIKITTNGTLVNGNTADFLKKYGVNEVQVSIHASYARLGDAMNGVRGSHAKTAAALDIMLEKNINVTTKTTVTARNIRDIPALCKMLSSKGIKKMKFSEVFQMGSAFRKNMKPSAAELKKLAAFFDNLDDERVIFQSETLNALKNKFAAVCSLGDKYATTMEILADGTVLPCAYAVVFEEGLNIFKTGLKGAWEALTDYKKYNTLPDECIGCPGASACSGGCPARARIYKTAKDPLCPVGKKNEKEMV